MNQHQSRGASWIPGNSYRILFAWWVETLITMSAGIIVYKLLSFLPVFLSVPVSAAAASALFYFPHFNARYYYVRFSTDILFQTLIHFFCLLILLPHHPDNPVYQTAYFLPFITHLLINFSFEPEDLSNLSSLLLSKINAKKAEKITFPSADRKPVFSKFFLFVLFFIILSFFIENNTVKKQKEWVKNRNASDINVFHLRSAGLIQNGNEAKIYRYLKKNQFFQKWLEAYGLEFKTSSVHFFTLSYQYYLDQVGEKINRRTMEKHLKSYLRLTEDLFNFYLDERKSPNLIITHVSQTVIFENQSDYIKNQFTKKQFEPVMISPDQFEMYMDEFYQTVNHYNGFPKWIYFNGPSYADGELAINEYVRIHPVEIYSFLMQTQLSNGGMRRNRFIFDSPEFAEDLSTYFSTLQNDKPLIISTSSRTALEPGLLGKWSDLSVDLSKTRFVTLPVTVGTNISEHHRYHFEWADFVQALSGTEIYTEKPLTARTLLRMNKKMIQQPVFFIPLNSSKKNEYEQMTGFNLPAYLVYGLRSHQRKSNGIINQFEDLMGRLPFFQNKTQIIGLVYNENHEILYNQKVKIERINGKIRMQTSKNKPLFGQSGKRIEITPISSRPWVDAYHSYDATGDLIRKYKKELPDFIHFLRPFLSAVKKNVIIFKDHPVIDAFIDHGSLYISEKIYHNPMLLTIYAFNHFIRSQHPEKVPEKYYRPVIEEFPNYFGTLIDSNRQSIDRIRQLIRNGEQTNRFTAGTNVFYQYQKLSQTPAYFNTLRRIHESFLIRSLYLRKLPPAYLPFIQEWNPSQSRNFWIDHHSKLTMLKLNHALYIDETFYRNQILFPLEMIYQYEKFTEKSENSEEG